MRKAVPFWIPDAFRAGRLFLSEVFHGMSEIPDSYACRATLFMKLAEIDQRLQFRGDMKRPSNCCT